MTSSLHELNTECKETVQERAREKPYIPYILESNPHPFYSCRGLKGQMRIRIECGLDSRSSAGVWPNDEVNHEVLQNTGAPAEIRTENLPNTATPARMVIHVKGIVIFFFITEAKTRCGLDSRIYGICLESTSCLYRGTSMYKATHTVMPNCNIMFLFFYLS
jgi:hypothetical protein